MRIVQLVKYAGVAAISGTIGFLIGGGQLPDSLREAPRELASRAQTLQSEDTTVTGVLNSMRDRVTDGVRRMAGALNDDEGN